VGKEQAYLEILSYHFYLGRNWKSCVLLVVGVVVVIPVIRVVHYSLEAKLTEDDIFEIAAR
jgi:hypothetical protein